MRETDPTDTVLDSPFEVGNEAVIAIGDPSFGGVGWIIRWPASSYREAHQEMSDLDLAWFRWDHDRSALLNCIKSCLIHDRWLLSGQDFTLVFDLAI